MKYLIYRIVLASYFIFVFALSLYTAEELKQTSFYAIYLTNWNVILNTFSSLFGAVLVAIYYRRQITFDDDNRSMTTSFKAYWLLSNLSTVVCISLSLVYWPLIYTGRDKGLTDDLTHAGNAIVLFIDIFFNAHPPRFGHFVYPLGMGIVYSYLFSLPYTLLGGTDRDFNNFIYSVLDWTNDFNGALTFSLATMFFLIFMHFVLTILATARVLLYEKRKSRRIIVEATDITGVTTSHQV